MSAHGQTWGAAPLDAHRLGLLRTYLSLPPEVTTIDAGALLGLGVDELNERGIIAALQRRLETVSRHPESASPGADEVRMMLHAAAARLLGSQARPEAPSSAHASPEAAALEAAILQALSQAGGWNHDAMQRVAMLAHTHGVTVPFAMSIVQRLLGMPAKVDSPRPAPALPRVPQPLRPPTATPSPPARSHAASTPVSRAFDLAAPPPPLSGLEPVADESDDPGARVIRNVLVFGGAAVLAISGAIVAAMMLASTPESAPLEAAANNPAPSAPNVVQRELFPAPEKAASNAAAIPPRVGDFTDVLRSLASASGGASLDIEAGVSVYERTYPALSRKWIESTPDAHIAALDTIIELLYKVASDSEAAQRVLAPIIADALLPGSPASPDVSAERLPLYVFSVGALARLSRETDLPTPIRRTIAEGLRAAFPPGAAPAEATFRAGAWAALSVLPLRIIQPDATTRPESSAPAPVGPLWVAWATTLGAVEAKDSAGFQRATLFALDSVLTNAPEPNLSQPVFESVQRLISLLTWRSGDESRRWMLRWFDASAVSSPDLHALTTALAGLSKAPGVDMSMVLSPVANATQRSEMRDRYATVWGMGDRLDRAEVVATLLDRAASTLGSGEPAHDSLLPSALRMARLSHAAALIWNGDPIEGANAMSRAQSTPGVAAQSTPGGVVYTITNPVGTLHTPGANEDWAVKYRAARSDIPARRELLANFPGSFTPMMAEILVGEATRGSPATLRAEARRIVERNRGQAIMVAALLESAAQLPPTGDVSDLVAVVANAPIPSPRDPDWRVAIRRGLVERLMELLAGSNGQGVDAFARDLADTYALPQSRPVSSSGSDSGGAGNTAIGSDPNAPLPDPPVVEVAARAIRDKLFAEASALVASGREPLPIAIISARHAARQRLAVGRIQHFVAHQISAVELLSYLVSNERADAAEQVRLTLDRLDVSRRKASTIWEQIEAAERARLELWRLRFGGAAL